MGRFHDKRFPGESDAYRRARDALLKEEIELRRRIEEVAAMRRGLPSGGALKQDYIFEEGAADPADDATIRETRFSELFAAGKDSLIHGPGESCRGRQVAHSTDTPLGAHAGLGPLAIVVFSQQRLQRRLRRGERGVGANAGDQRFHQESAGHIPLL